VLRPQRLAGQAVADPQMAGGFGDPRRRLCIRQDRQELGIRQRFRRHLDGRLVVTVKHNRDAARFQPVDRCCQKIACDALNDILDERTEPAPIRLPLAAGVVHELNIGRGIFEFARY